MSKSNETPRLLDKFISKYEEILGTTDIQGFEFMMKNGCPYITISYLREIKFFKMNEDYVFD